MSDNKYSAESIVVLEGLEPVRKRPGMYIGTTSQPGVNHVINEIVDNAIDESLAGFAKNIHIVIEENGYMTVYDDGRGIPVDIIPKYKKSALELVMTMLHAGGKFPFFTFYCRSKTGWQDLSSRVFTRCAKIQCQTYQGVAT